MNNIEKIRLPAKNATNIEIKKNEMIIQRIKNTIDKLLSQKTSEFSKTQIIKLKAEQKLTEDKLIASKEYYENLLSGNLDNELLEELSENKKKQELIEQKSIDKNKKKMEEKKKTDSLFNNKNKNYKKK
jgi:hypothetical protein